jgi:hypothetical protein
MPAKSERPLAIADGSPGGSGVNFDIFQFAPLYALSTPAKYFVLFV